MAFARSVNTELDGVAGSSCFERNVLALNYFSRDQSSQAAGIQTTISDEIQEGMYTGTGAAESESPEACMGIPRKWTSASSI